MYSKIKQKELLLSIISQIRELMTYINAQYTIHQLATRKRIAGGRSFLFLRLALILVLALAPVRVKNNICMQNSHRHMELDMGI